MSSPRLTYGGDGRLSTREYRVLVHLASGYTTRQTARELGITAPEARAATDRLRWKMGATNIASTVARAFCLGLLDPQANYEKEARGSAGNRPGRAPECVSDGAR